jgi:putative Mg2+ transporter-C (MgtC) family protein
MNELTWLVDHGTSMGLQVLAAALCGSVVGYERARSDGPAGMKTCMLVCVGATLYAHVGVVQFETLHEGDPSRIAAQIVSGIGFLGAGAILRGNEGVTGLTTAAAIWFIGSIGIIIGCGFPISGALVTVLVIALMQAVRVVEAHLLPDRAARMGAPDGGDV